MAPAPLTTEEYLQRAITEVEREISSERVRIAALAEAIDKGPPQFHEKKKGSIIVVEKKTREQRLFPEMTRLYNLLTRRHALEVLKTYSGSIGPNASLQVLYQVEYVGIRDVDTGELIKYRGKKRIVDVVLRSLDQHPISEMALMIEVKTLGEILRSFPAIGKLTLEQYAETASFVRSSKLGDQIKREIANIKRAKAKGVAVFEGYSPLTGKSVSFEVWPQGIRISGPQTYRAMGDGINVAYLTRRSPGAAGALGAGTGSNTDETVSDGSKLKAPTSARATADRKTANPVGSGPGEIRVSETPRHSFQEALPKRPPRRGSPIDVGSVARRVTPTGELAALEFYQWQMNSVTRKAFEAADAELATRRKEMDAWRARGYWVQPYALFTEPAQPDVFGLEYGSFVTFWGAGFDYAPADYDAQGRAVMNERTLRMLVPQTSLSADGGPRGLAMRPREVPHGRKLVRRELDPLPPMPHIVDFREEQRMREYVFGPSRRVDDRFVQRRCTKDHPTLPTPEAGSRRVR